MIFLSFCLFDQVETLRRCWHSKKSQSIATFHRENMKIEGNFHKSFHHSQPEDFVQSQWQKDRKSQNFLTFRWTLSALFIVIVFLSWVRALCSGSFGVWWIYMTDWGILLCMISTLIGALMTTLYHDDALVMTPQSIEYKIYWFLTTIATNLAFVITTFYYGLLYFRKSMNFDVKNFQN